MISTNLQGVADLIVRQAQRQGYILPRHVRTALSEIGLCKSLWKDVLRVAQSSLAYRQGRYYYSAPVSERVLQERKEQLGVLNAVREIIQRHRKAVRVERREEDRIDFVQSVKVRTEDGHDHTLLTRDLSTTGIRLIGTRRLLGQKVRVSIPNGGDGANWEFVVRILWTGAVGEDLVENGGVFLELSAAAIE